MDEGRLQQRVAQHLQFLVDDVGPRPPGSSGNHRANTYIWDLLERNGLAPRADAFTSRIWSPAHVELIVDGEAVAAVANPYSRPADVTGVVHHLTEAETMPMDGSACVLVVGHGEAPEPVMPKAFPFFTPADDAALIKRIEALEPAAVITVSDGPPIFEDPDLTFPSLTVPSSVAARLSDGTSVRVRIGGAVRDVVGVNISASTGDAGRTVVSAHVDSKATTPGAFDNATGVAALLAWIEAGALPQAPLEFVFFNGEDHFDACGEQVWLAATDLSQVAANINLDGIGCRDRATTVSALAASPAMEREVAAFADAREGWKLAAPWFDSDHGLFAMQGIPAIAVTSAGVLDLMTTVAHTPRDTLDMVDTATVADVAMAMGGLVRLTRPS